MSTGKDLRAESGPFSHGAETHVRVMKSEALQSALEQYEFDVMIDGARGDEERFRAGSRRSDTPRDRSGPTRVFPLRNWTEIDVWRYVQAEKHSVAHALLRRPAAGGTEGTEC